MLVSESLPDFPTVCAGGDRSPASAGGRLLLHCKNNQDQAIYLWTKLREKNDSKATLALCEFTPVHGTTAPLDARKATESKKKEPVSVVHIFYTKCRPVKYECNSIELLLDSLW